MWGVWQEKKAPHWDGNGDPSRSYGAYMANNLKILRAKKGWSQQEAADAMHVSKGQYIKLERGERRLTEAYISSAARAFGVPDAAVIEEIRTVPVVGYVGAGSEAHFYDGADDPGEDAPMPEGGTSSTVAVIVRGDSLGSLFNHWLVYYDEVRLPLTDDLLRKLCVVGLSDGRVLVKQVLKGTRPGRYHLVSQTQGLIEDAHVVWAAAVIGMSPRA